MHEFVISVYQGAVGEYEGAVGDNVYYKIDVITTLQLLQSLPCIYNLPLFLCLSFHTLLTISLSLSLPLSFSLSLSLSLSV